MAEKDIHSEVEGHGAKIKRSEDAEPESTDAPASDNEPEVEGQGIKGKFAPDADVEGHAGRLHGRCEDPATDESLEQQDVEASKAEVEGQAIRGKAPVSDVEGHGSRFNG